MSEINFEKTADMLFKFRNLLEKRENEIVQIGETTYRGARTAHFSTNNIPELINNLVLEARILKTIVIELEKVQKHKDEILSNKSTEDAHSINFLRIYAKDIDNYLENYKKYLKEVVRVYAKLEKNKNNISSELISELMLKIYESRKIINL
ncbi:MAG: hypothetical protein PHU51_02960 [Candidatus Nanoarchaeia archaeon]|nr:hypothetical protein [Candidatus Nanoarchaeia archaeon]